MLQTIDEARSLTRSNLDGVRFVHGPLYCCGLSPFTLCAVSRRTNVRFFPFGVATPTKLEPSGAAIGFPFDNVRGLIAKSTPLPAEALLAPATCA
jgi:hypothetical protein